MEVYTISILCIYEISRHGLRRALVDVAHHLHNKACFISTPTYKRIGECLLEQEWNCAEK